MPTLSNHQQRIPYHSTLARCCVIATAANIPDSQESHASQSRGQTSVHSDTESLDAIPYGENDVVTRDDKLDDEFPVVLD